MDSIFCNEVAAVVGTDVAKSAAVMPLVFTEWVVQKTEDEGWVKNDVYKLLCRANKDDKTAAFICL